MPVFYAASGGGIKPHAIKSTAGRKWCFFACLFDVRKIYF